MNVNANERKVLQFLVDEGTDYAGFLAFSFDTICGPTELGRKAVRRACRSLARKGLAEYCRGLWTEDGEPAGSGYCATRASEAVLATGKCDD
jgi:hypothetical protein